MVERMFCTRSNSSLDSSSRPGSNARMIAFRAGRREPGSTSKMYFSNRVKTSGLTESDPNDNTGVRPGR